VQAKAAPVGKGYDARLGEKVARHDAKHIRGAGKIERLALLRHAKAERGLPVPDRERPLTERGREEARLAARALNCAAVTHAVRFVVTR
jgi:hypothetical protein